MKEPLDLTNGPAAPFVPEYSNLLIDARKKCGLDQRAVASNLRIRMAYIQAIDNGDTASLPEGPYTLGFLRSYSRLVGLDDDNMVRLFLEHSKGSNPDKNILEDKKANFNESSRDKMMFFVLGIVAIVVIVLVAKVLIDNRQPSEAVETPQQEVALPIQETVPVNNELPEVGEAVSDQENNEPENDYINAPQALLEDLPAGSIIITAKEQVWVEISDDTGTIILSKVFQPNDIYVVPDRNDLLLATGNAPGVVVHFGKDEWSQLSEEGDALVRRKVSLQVENLRRLLPQN